MDFETQTFSDIQEFWKRGIILEWLDWPSQTSMSCTSTLHRDHVQQGLFRWLKTVWGFWDTTYHQQTKHWVTNWPTVR